MAEALGCKGPGMLLSGALVFGSQFQVLQGRTWEDRKVSGEGAGWLLLPLGRNGQTLKNGAGETGTGVSLVPWDGRVWASLPHRAY